MTSGYSVLQITDDDVRKILSAQAFKCMGSDCSHLMRRYTYKTSIYDKFVIFDIRKMWEKLMLAARAIAAIKNPADICVIGARQEVQRAVLKFASHTGAMAIAGRFTPGSFTNQITKVFKEPLLIIVSDPSIDQQAIKEASYVNIPVIAFAGPTSPTQCVDIVIPCNIHKEAHNSMGLMWWLLCREVLRLRGNIDRKLEWKVKVDLFIYRSPEQMKLEQLASASGVGAGADAQQHHDLQQTDILQPDGLSIQQNDSYLDDDLYMEPWNNKTDLEWTSSRLAPPMHPSAQHNPSGGSSHSQWPRI